MSDAKAKGWEGHVTRKALSEFQRCELQSFGIHRHAYARTIPVTVLPRETAAALREFRREVQEVAARCRNWTTPVGIGGEEFKGVREQTFVDCANWLEAALARLDAAGGAE